MDTEREDVFPSAHSEGLKAEVVNLPNRMHKHRQKDSP